MDDYFDHRKLPVNMLCVKMGGTLRSYNNKKLFAKGTVTIGAWGPLTVILIN
jgi:hypothetical protein